MDKLNTYLLSICFSLFLILAPFFTLLFSQTFYHYEFNKLGVYEEGNTNENIEFNNKIKESLQSLIKFFLYKSDSISNYNENEISHMKDVRKIFLVLEITLILSLLILVLCLFKLSKQSLMRILKYSSIVSLIFILILVLLSIYFEQALLIFHQIFFPQGNWMFPQDSFMIHMFPSDFFLNFLVTSLVISGLISLILLILSFSKTYKLNLN